MTKKEECLKALQCLYLEVDATIADDVKRRVLEALDEANKNFVLADVMPSLPELDEDSNCDHNFRLGWEACWQKLTEGNGA